MQIAQDSLDEEFAALAEGRRTAEQGDTTAADDDMVNIHDITQKDRSNSLMRVSTSAIDIRELPVEMKEIDLKEELRGKLGGENFNARNLPNMYKSANTLELRGEETRPSLQEVTISRSQLKSGQELRSRTDQMSSS